MIISSVISTKLDYALFHTRSWGQPFWVMTMACPKRVRSRLVNSDRCSKRVRCLSLTIPISMVSFFWIIFFPFYLFIYSYTTFYFLIYSTLFPFLFFYFMVKSILCQPPQKNTKKLVWLCQIFLVFFVNYRDIYLEYL